MINPQHEPTMEEILASIRKIISDDATSAPVTASAVHGTGEPDVLDLTQEVDAPAMLTAATDHAAEVKPDDSHPAAPNEAPADPVAEPASAREAEKGVYTEGTRNALTEALANIHSQTLAAVAAEKPARAAAPVFEETAETVFDRAVKDAFDPILRKWLTENNAVVVERLKPVIRDWLDANFPALLEETIRGELARAAKPRSGR